MEKDKSKHIQETEPNKVQPKKTSPQQDVQIEGETKTDPQMEWKK